MAAHFGLDIGSTSIKILKIDGKKISAVVVAANPSNKNLMAMNNAEKIALADHLKELIKSAGLKGKQVVASISESLVFSKLMQLPIMSSPELATAIKWELDQSVPFPPNEVETSWAVLNKPNKINPNYWIDNKVLKPFTGFYPHFSYRWNSKRNIKWKQ